MTISLDGSPYTIDATGQRVFDKAAALQERANLLRDEGKLSERTLRAYFGDRRFEQIAESNAIEGSTLSVGETQLAVERGITITGHDPAYTADAVNLSRALEYMVELADDPSPTDLTQVKELHRLVLGGGQGAGAFRSAEVRISGSPHTPPATWGQVMSAMEHWERWSADNNGAPALLRAIVLHAWLTHIHPFADGNGRTSRAVMNLELIRAGLPSGIIRRKDRLRYYEALAESDLRGDLQPLANLVLARAEDALRDLERAATRHQGYDATEAKLRTAQANRAAIWNDAVRLMFSLLEDAIDSRIGSGSVMMRSYEGALSVEDYAALSDSDSSGNTWLFRIDVEYPGLGRNRFLAWVGYRSADLRQARGLDAGPSIFWSVPDEWGGRQWARAYDKSPGAEELTLELPKADRWLALSAGGAVVTLRPSEVAARVADAIVDALTA